MKPVGDRGLLLELSDNASVHAAGALARERHGDQLVEVVPGHETLLLVFRDGGVIPDSSDLELQRASCEPSAVDTSHRQARVIPTRYDGPDLTDVAAQLGLSVEAVVALHTGAAYTVAFMGFAPGFPYLLADEPQALLELPRLRTPRTEVPAGSVAVAAGYCGIYPGTSPGGWNLLGRTELVMFDSELATPALLEPGTPVRFEAI